MCIQFSSEISSGLVLLKIHPLHEIQNAVLFPWWFIFLTVFRKTWIYNCVKDSRRTTPLGPYVVSTILSPVSRDEQHFVFFHNFFCKPPVVVWPGCHRYESLWQATVRENWTGRCPLIANKDRKKQPRGSYDKRSDGSVICVRWNDNCPVTIASHYFFFHYFFFYQQNRKTG